MRETSPSESKASRATSRAGTPPKPNCDTRRSSSRSAAWLPESHTRSTRRFNSSETTFVSWQEAFASLGTLLARSRDLRSALASGGNVAELAAETQRLEEELECDYLLEELPRAIAETLEGVERVATIVNAMREFAHPASKEMAGADLNKALLGTLAVARHELKYVAEVETDFGDLPLVVCRLGDLNQVFLNLLVNAAHAIGEVVNGTDEKGRIHVRTRSEGDRVLISISDTGAGIPEDIRSRIFDPFFTTKKLGRGTGQGLAIARSVVVERHQGTLTFETEVGKGTTFHLRLPVNPMEAPLRKAA